MPLGQGQQVLAGSTDVLDQRPARARFMIDSALYPTSALASLRACGADGAEEGGCDCGAQSFRTPGLSPEFVGNLYAWRKSREGGERTRGPAA